MVVSIGAVASPAQGVSYYERDGYYAKDDPAHREASVWLGGGAEALGLKGPVDPDLFKSVLEGEVPDGSGRKLGRMDRDGNRVHRPGRDLTFSAPKSVSLAALVGGDKRVVDAHDRAVRRAVGWLEKNVAETRVMDPKASRLIRVGGQRTVIAGFRHDTSRNLDPQLHTHAVIANMVQSAEDARWRTMSNEKIYTSKMLIGALYRSELASELRRLGYSIEKTHADGRFEIAGTPRKIVEAFSTRRAAIETAMAERSLGDPGANPRLAERAALMTRAYKRDVDKDALTAVWEKQAAELGFDARALVAEALSKTTSKDIERESAQIKLPLSGHEKDGPEAPPSDTARAAVEWAVAHLAEREAVFSRADLLAAAIARQPGAVAISEAESVVARMERDGALHAANLPVPGESLTTDKALADERETIALMERGQKKSRPVMRSWMATPFLHRGRLNIGQREAVRTILASRDQVIGVQGYAGTGKTTMLGRARGLAEKTGYRMIGLAPSASAARTLGEEAGIESETLQRFLARYSGVAEGRLGRKGKRELRAAFRKTVLVVDEGSLASTLQTRNLLRIVNTLRIPRVVLVGDEKQLDAVDAGKPFAQLQRAGMTTAVMDEILRQKDAELRKAVEASLAGDIKSAFEKLGERVAEVNPDNLAGAAAARWLKLSERERENTGLMAPSHALRREINGHIRERLARDGVIRGPAHQGERLVSLGYTNAEKTVAANYAPGDTVAFHRNYRSLGVEKGEERRVARVDSEVGTVFLEAPKGDEVPWRPRMVGAKRGAVEVYRSEGIELRAGDRIRWTRNDVGLRLVNSGTAEVASVRGSRVSFRLEDGRTLDLWKHDPQLRHLDHAWAATVHGFQGRTVDNVIAVMEASHPHLTTRKSFYVEISRARHRAELVTDDARALSEELEAVTGERVAALEAVEPAMDQSEVQHDGKHKDAALDIEPTPDTPDIDSGRSAAKEAPEPSQREPEPVQEKVRDFEMEM